MQSFEKQILSGSSNGRGIKVAATATPGTTIHTAVAGTTNIDEVYVYAFNIHTADVLLTIEYGGVINPNNLIEYTVPFQSGLFLVVPGMLLQAGVDVAAFAATTNVIVIYGYVNRISK